jgi:hypothetical protein
MSTDVMARYRLQQVAAYRELCRAVRKTGRENVFFALLMLGLAYLSFPNGGGRGLVQFVFALYLGLALAEFAVGLFKFIRPSAEGILLDGLVLLMFAGWNIGWQGLRLVAGVPPQVVIALLGVFMLFQAVERFRSYGRLRRLFRERPSPDQIAWFDDLVREIRAADPDQDDTALDLPTRGRWKAKLLGDTGFFVRTKGGEAVVIAGPGDFAILRDDKDHGTGKRKALLQLHDQHLPEFEIADATWNNYQKWVRSRPAPSFS